MCLLPLLSRPVASEKFSVGDLVEKMRISEARYAHREGEIWLNSYKEFVSSGSVLRQGEIQSNRTNILGILIHNNGDYDFEVLWSHCVCEVDINMLLSLSLFVKTEDGCSVSFNTLLCVDLLYNLSLRHGLQGFDILIQKMELTSEKCYFLLDWFCPAMFNSHIRAHMQRMERRFQLVDDVDQVLVLFPMMSQLLLGKLRMSLVQPLDSPVFLSAIGTNITFLLPYSIALLEELLKIEEVIYVFLLYGFCLLDHIHCKLLTRKISATRSKNGDAEDKDGLDKMGLFFDCRALLEQQNRDCCFISHTIVVCSGWFGSILELLYCSLPRPPEDFCDFGWLPNSHGVFKSKMQVPYILRGSIRYIGLVGLVMV